MKKILCLYFVIFCSHLFSEPTSLTFSDWENLAEYHDKTVQIKGFLYEKEPSLFILAREPNLKSCCLGSHNQKPQIHINDIMNVTLSKNALTLQGRLSTSYQNDDNGKTTISFYLDQIKIIDEPNKYNISIVLTISLALIIISAIYQITFKKFLVGKLS